MNRIPTVLNWSSGKDAALAYHILQNSDYEVKTLLTTINDEYDRIVMHGVREELLDAQAAAMNIAHRKIRLPASPSDDTYKRAMADALTKLKAEGMQTAAFGDIFLEDLKAYREQQLVTIGFDAVFPLWKRDTRELIQVIEQTGIEAIIVCLNDKFLDKSFLGRKIDSSFLNDLPAGVDPCGENGEFHTYVYNAPCFTAPVTVKEGEIVYKSYTPTDHDTDKWNTGYWFLDLLPA